MLVFLCYPPNKSQMFRSGQSRPHAICFHNAETQTPHPMSTQKVYLSFFFGRSWFVWPHLRLRQLVARGGRRACETLSAHLPRYSRLQTGPNVRSTCGRSSCRS